MKITVRQLKQLIREATEEAVEEMHGGRMMNEKEPEDQDEGMYEEDMHEKEEAVMMEAVKAAYRAGLRKGRSVRR